MLKGLYTAWTGMVNEQKRMDIMTNNLANASTVGFKKEGSTSQAFDDVLALKIKDASMGDERIVQPLAYNTPGVKIGENYTDFTQGSFRITENTYDLALAGETSTMYTRAGQFTLTNEGYLVNENGDYVLDVNNSRIQVDPLLDARIDDDGIIWQNEAQTAQIQVADFEDYNYLEKYGETYFRPVEGAELTQADAAVKSGWLEMSNVQIVSEMVNMISITRAYETNQKIIQTYDSSLEIAVTQLGRLQG